MSSTPMSTAHCRARGISKVTAYLAEHPHEAAAGEAFRAQIAGVKAIFDSVLDEPVPERLHRILARAPLARRSSSLCLLAAMFAALAVASLTVLARSRVAGMSSMVIHIPAAVKNHPPADQRLPVLPPPAGGPTRTRSAEI